MLAFSINYYGLSFRATQSVELFCAYFTTVAKEQIQQIISNFKAVYNALNETACPCIHIPLNMYTRQAILLFHLFDFHNYLKNSLTDAYTPPVLPHFHLPLRLSADALLLSCSPRLRRFPDEMLCSPQMPE